MRSQPPTAKFYAGVGRLQCYSLTLTAPQLTADQCGFLADEFARHGLPRDAVEAPDPTYRLFTLTIALHAVLLRESGFFFPESAQIVRADEQRGKFSVAVPKIPTGGTMSPDLFVKLINLCAKSARGGTPIDSWLEAIRGELAAVTHQATTAAHFARAAYELEMPLIEWRQPFLQIGYGRNAIVVSGSITQSSPSIGVHFAREKTWTNELLANAGLPVAEGAMVKDVAEANELAAALGYPVVIKPADRDGGTAVSSGIANPTELAQAFARARAASENVLLEKHIDGIDYRLLFFHDELLVAIERTPGGVTGNGRDTVAQLLAQHNESLKHDTGPPRHQIRMDDEARIMLDRLGLTVESVPEDARFVPLRRAANHALGGSVRLAQDIHPDNLDLARRAMRLLRLDIAGLDLILPDISQSWHETGGVVCEINAQPFIGEPINRDFYKEILQQIVPGNGRIPVVLVIGTLDPKTIAALTKAIPGLAVTDADGTRRDGRPLSPKDAKWPRAVQTALYDQATSAILCQLDPAQHTPILSPADRFDAAFVIEAPAQITPPLATLLGRAEQIRAIDLAALKSAGIAAAPIAAGEVKAALAVLLAGGLTPAVAPKPARPAPAPRETAPPASRKRR